MRAANKPKKSAAGKTVFKKLAGWLHLWLGLISGIIVVIISLTGAVYVFEREIRSLTEPWRFVAENKTLPALPPSALVKSAGTVFGQYGMKPSGLSMGIPGEAAEVRAFDAKTTLYLRVSVDPYTGQILHIKRSGGKSSDFDFFRFVLDGHRSLWLPYKIGRPIVGVAVLVFAVMLITGLILWWPQKWIRSIRDKSFKIKWKASFKRVNYDLHNVLGFYSSFFLLIIALTGLIWSFDWVSRSLYWLTSGGKPLVERTVIGSDTLSVKDMSFATVDVAWRQVNVADRPKGLFISLPAKRKDVIGITAYLREGTYYKVNVYRFDQFSLKPLKGSGPYAGLYEEASAADKLRKMNYDLHVGAILGLPGKFIAFFAALISASLPITGFLIWWGRNKNKTVKKAVARQAAVQV